jgi:hypothetical protein
VFDLVPVTMYIYIFWRVKPKRLMSSFTSQEVVVDVSPAVPVTEVRREAGERGGRYALAQHRPDAPRRALRG